MSENPDNESTGSPQEEQASGKSRSILPVILVILVLLVAGFGYFNYRNYLALSEALSSLEDNQVLIAGLESNLATLSDESSRSRSTLGDNEASIRLLEESLSELYGNLDTDNEDWAMAEIEQLIITASHQLQLEADVSTALAAMIAADNRLKGINNPEIIDIRRQTTADINRLRSVNVPDYAGMALQLLDLAGSVTQLPLKQGMVESTPEDDDLSIDSNEQQSLWQKFTATVWGEIKGLVSISRRNEDRIITLLPDQKYYLYQNLRLELNIARLSILQRDSSSLGASIMSIESWLDTYFDTSDAAVINVMETLEAIGDVELVTDLPDVNSSLETVRAYIRGKQEI